jgi:Flp pilus assembly protein TadG
MRKANLLLENRRGFTLVLIAFMLTLLLASAAAAVDFGRMYVLEAELHTASDAAALAGAERIMAGDILTTAPADTANAYAGRHKVDGHAVTLTDVSPGKWTFPNTFTPATWATANAISVTATYNNAPYYFARIFGLTTQNMKRTSIAAVGSVGKADCVRPWAIPYELMLQALYPTSTPDPLTYDLTQDDVTRLSVMTSANNVSLKIGSQQGNVQIVNGNFYSVELPPIEYADGSIPSPGPWSGSKNYGDALGDNCKSLDSAMASRGGSIDVGVGDWLAPENGNMPNAARDGVQALCHLKGNNYTCASPGTRVDAAMWDTVGNAPGVSGCGGKCFHIKYMSVFYVTGWDDAAGAVTGYFKTMAAAGPFTTVPGPVRTIVLVK